jgi:hypothetical protein
MFERGLSKQGYTVLRPHDEDVTLFPSGLLTAINTNEFHILSSCFCSYLTYTNVDRFANKGFFTVHVMDRKTGRKAYIVNTHMQSDWEGSILLGNKITKDVRRKQAEQILEYFQGVSDPVLLVGDLNQEYNPHPYLRFLHPPSKQAKIWIMLHGSRFNGRPKKDVGSVTYKVADLNCASVRSTLYLGVITLQ